MNMTTFEELSRMVPHKIRHIEDGDICAEVLLLAGAVDNSAVGANDSLRFFAVSSKGNIAYVSYESVGYER